MDYAFAPGRTSYDRRMRGLMGRRANTSVIHNRQTRSVEKFVDHLETDGGVTRPVDDILIASHGNSSGNMQIVLFQGSGSRTTFEVLMDAKLNGKVIIPMAVPQPAGGGTGSTTMHIKGCKIGQAPIMMQTLKEAFGSHLPTLTAPKHFHALYYISSHGYFEHLMYSFSLKFKDAQTNRNNLITAFQGGGFQFIDGTAVPNGNWANWIPRNIRRRRSNSRMRVTFGSTFGRLSRLRLQRQYRHDVIRFSFQVTGVNSNPSAANRFTMLSNAINGHAMFQAGHTYPMYERYGFASAADFLNGFNWRYTYQRRAKKLICNGTRHNYEVALPITDPTTNDLICNFFPKAGVSHASFTNLLETDNRLFLTV